MATAPSPPRAIAARARSPSFLSDFQRFGQPVARVGEIPLDTSKHAFCDECLAAGDASLDGARQRQDSLRLDIDHVFPKAWCESNNVDPA